MQFKTQSHVSMMKPSKGSFKDENTGEDRPYDSTKVTIETELKDDFEGFGVGFVEYNWGLSDNYYEFVRKFGVNKPFDAEITWENVSNGKTSKLVVVDVKPLQDKKI